MKDNNIGDVIKYEEYTFMKNKFAELMDKGSNWLGFCYVVPTEISNDYQGSTVDLIRERYPELYAHKPEVNEDEGYWFNRRLHVKRLIILTSIVDEVWSRMSIIDKARVKIRAAFRLGKRLY